MQSRLSEICYVNDEKLDVRRYHAHSDNSLAFYAYDGEFVSLNSGVSYTGSYSYLKQSYIEKLIKNKISNHSFTLAYVTAHYVPEHSEYTFTVDLLNNVIKYVDEALEENELYQINKFKKLTGIDVGYSPKNPSRVIIYSPKLMVYYDGLNWEKIYPQFVN